MGTRTAVPPGAAVTAVSAGSRAGPGPRGGPDAGASLRPRRRLRAPSAARPRHAAEAGEGAAAADLPRPHAAHRARALPAGLRALPQPAVRAAGRLQPRCAGAGGGGRGRARRTRGTGGRSPDRGREQRGGRSAPRERSAPAASETRAARASLRPGWGPSWAPLAAEGERGAGGRAPGSPPGLQTAVPCPGGAGPGRGPNRGVCSPPFALGPRVGLAFGSTVQTAQPGGSPSPALCSRPASF